MANQLSLEERLQKSREIVRGVIEGSSGLKIGEPVHWTVSNTHGQRFEPTSSIHGAHASGYEIRDGEKVVGQVIVPARGTFQIKLLKHGERHTDMQSALRHAFRDERFTTGSRSSITLHPFLKPITKIHMT